MPNMRLRWIKARRSAGLNACVELALGDDGVLMRSSRAPGVHLHHTPREFAIFIEAVKNGEFDHMLPDDVS